MMWKWGTPKTSSWTVIPGSRFASPARRSLVASSNSYKCAICAGGSPSRESTLSPSSKKRLGIRRRVSSCSRCLSLGSTVRCLRSAATRVQQLAHPDHVRHAAFTHVSQRRFAGKNRIRIRQLHPGVGKFCAVENVQCFEDADQQGNASKFVLIERLRNAALELVEGTVRDAAQKIASI